MGLLDMFYTANKGLAPISPPVGVYSHLAHGEPLTLVLRERTLSKDHDISVHDDNGEVLFRCKGTMFSLHDRKKVTDAQGALLFNISETLLSTSTFVAADRAGKEVLRVKKQHSLGSKLHATFLDAEKERIAHVQGDFWSGDAAIALEDGTRLAHIDRRAGPVQAYHVTVAPGVDVALVATLCILLDEVRTDNSDSVVMGLAKSGIMKRLI